MSDDFKIPRCEHGAIVLGCDKTPCDVQDHYLDDQNKAIEAYRARQDKAIVKYVRSLLGLGEQP